MNLIATDEIDSTAWLDEGDDSKISDEIFKNHRKSRSNLEIEDMTRNEAVTEDDSEEGSDEFRVVTKRPFFFIKTTTPWNRNFSPLTTSPKVSSNQPATPQPDYKTIFENTTKRTFFVYSTRKSSESPKIHRPLQEESTTYMPSSSSNVPFVPKNGYSTMFCINGHCYMIRDVLNLLFGKTHSSSNSAEETDHDSTTRLYEEGDRNTVLQKTQCYYDTCVTRYCSNGGCYDKYYRRTATRAFDVDTNNVEKRTRCINGHCRTIYCLNGQCSNLSFT